ncbi:MAG: tetratricopeptide repeat protein [Ignavibacteria bacterium]|nr:tetratricopeptide repeat protein [Ignavibacteria bacterium]
MTCRTFDEIIFDVARAREVNDANALLRYADELDEHQTPLAAAHAHRSRGSAWYQLGDYTTAQEHFSQSIALFEELGDRVGVARVLTSIGAVHSTRGDLAMALECLHRALALGKETGDRVVESSVATNLGIVYFNTGDLTSALEHHYRALAIREELGDRNGIAAAMCNIGIALYSIDDYPAALEHLYRGLELSTELGNKRWAASALLSIGSISDKTGDYTTALEYYGKAAMLYEEVGDKSGIASTTTAIGWTHQNSGDLTAALSIHHRALALHQELGEVQASANDLCNIILVLLEQRLYDEARPHMETMDTIQIDDPALRIWREQCRAEIQAGSGDHDAAVATLQNALSEANDHGLRSKAADVRKALRDLAQKNNDLAGYIEHNNEYNRIINEINGKDTAARLATQEVERRIASERQEHQKQLAVLHSTLPKHIADRVARGETVNDNYDDAAILFLDIVSFSSYTSNMPPTDVVKMLEHLFTTVDGICETHSVVKIKTIGDSYMCFRGDADATTNATSIAQVALAAIGCAFTWPNGEPIQFRGGIHIGPATAGVIGTQRLQYDVWGDTVNVASRMESTSEPGRIHISEALANALVEHKNSPPSPLSHASLERGSYTVIPRGAIDVKGKGTMQTYWLEQTS